MILLICSARRSIQFTSKITKLLPGVRVSESDVEGSVEGMSRSVLGRAFVAASMIGVVRLGASHSTMTVDVDTSQTLNRLPSTFVSMGWEMDQMRGQTDMMADPRFVAAVSHLAPAVIRVGGITADWARYTGFEPPSRHTRTGEISATDQHHTVASGSQPEGGPTLRGYWPTSEFNLTFATFMKLHKFVAATNLSLMFDINEVGTWHTPMKN